MNRYDIILLDADNTLFDFDRTEREALEVIFTRRGYEYTPELMKTYHSINVALWDRFDRGEVTREWLTVERFALFQREWDGAVRHDPWQFNDDFQHTMGDLPYLLPGAEELCRTLVGMGASLSIVTNGLTIAQNRVKISSISDTFQNVYISQEMGCQKPQKVFFDKVLADLGVSDEEKGRVLMVGDNLVSDVQGGVNAGLDTVWFNHRKKENRTSIRPTYQIDALHELIPIVRGTR